MDRGNWQATIHGVAESDTAQQLNHHHWDMKIYSIPLKIYFIIAQQFNKKTGCTVKKYQTGIDIDFGSIIKTSGVTNKSCTIF